MSRPQERLDFDELIESEPAPVADLPKDILVAVAPDEYLVTVERILGAAHRMADARKVAWTVVCVESAEPTAPPIGARTSRIELFRMAESLGAETISVEGASPPQALAEFAASHGASTLVVGAPRPHFGWRRRISTVDMLIRSGVSADIVVIAREATPTAEGRDIRLDPRRRLWPKRLIPYVAALALTGVCSAITVPMLDHFDLVDMGMVYMLGATFAALRLGLGPAVFSSLANIAAFDYFLVPPRLSFLVTEPHYFVTFGVMLCVSIVIANLVSAVRRQTTAAAARERRTAALYSMSRELAITRDAASMAAIAERHIGDIAQSSVVVRVRDKNGGLSHRRGMGGRAPDPAICEWVVQHRQRAGAGSSQFSGDDCSYLPLIGSQDVRGVMALRPNDTRRVLQPDQNRLLEALTGQLALALERAWLAETAQAAHLAAERATLRNTLLASISHDLRTPLSAIAGAGSMMAHESFALDEHRRTTLGRLIEDKARDMTELLTNVLELMRLESGSLGVRREWHLLEDLIGLTLRQNAGRLGGRALRVDVPAELPMLFVDGGLLVQMLSNLIENCAKYTPPETHIVIAARPVGTNIVITIEDDGPGFPIGDPERLFDKFERGRAEGNIPGVGLGLAICRAVSRLHGGEIRAVPVESGGARFVITLPNPP